MWFKVKNILTLELISAVDFGEELNQRTMKRNKVSLNQADMDQNPKYGELHAVFLDFYSF